MTDEERLAFKRSELRRAQEMSGEFAGMVKAMREPNTEAGEYIEDDQVAWFAFGEALRRYADHLTALRRQYGDDAFGIIAGSMLSYMADQHNVFVRSDSPTVGERLDRPGNRANGTRQQDKR